MPECPLPGQLMEYWTSPIVPATPVAFASPGVVAGEPGYRGKQVGRYKLDIHLFTFLGTPVGLVGSIIYANGTPRKPVSDPGWQNSEVWPSSKDLSQALPIAPRAPGSSFSP